MHDRARRHLVADLAEGSRRAARNLDCPKCGAPCIRGDDHDEVAYVATVDAEALDDAAEMLAILDGLTTYDLVKARGKTARPGSHVLYVREPWNVDSTRPAPGTIHRLHRCERER